MEYEGFQGANTQLPSYIYDKASFVVKYLGLPAGNRFLIDSNGYEDVWFDESLLL